MHASTRILILVLGFSLTQAGGLAEAQQNRDRTEVNASKETELGYVQADRTLIYAGPSEEHYPTAALARGAVVEIAHRGDDGWLAIRPPAGSFNWLPASQGFLLSGGRVVEVTESTAVCWIGTALGTPKQYRWQNRVKRGDQLTVIGEKQSVSGTESEKKSLWYQVTPPTGEYRWIQAEAVSSQPPKELSQVVQAAATSTATGSAKSKKQTATAGEVQLAAAESPIDEEAAASETADDAGDSGVKPKSTAKSKSKTKSVQAPRAKQAKQPAAQVARDGDSENAEQWNSWHAMEMNGGSLSFPGVARMFGMEPAKPSAAAAAYDPFDLTAAPTRSRSSLSMTRATDPSWVDPYAGAPTGSGESNKATALASNASKGWRDPRQLRERRHNSILDKVPAGGGEVMLAGAEAEEIGTGVVLAGGTRPSMPSSSSNSESWHAIRQAPTRDVFASSSLDQADIEELQLRLSEMVAGPEQTWNLAPLADRTRFLIEHGSTALQRGQARLLLERIEAFGDVAARSQQLGISASPVGTAAASSLATTASRLASPLGIGNQVDDISSGNAPRFDATGWIVPVHSSGPNMPTHALTNDTGKIIVYLSPAAGVNLARYQGQAVGVYGLRGYLPHLKTNHIQVQRAVRLQ